MPKPPFPAARCGEWWDDSNVVMLAPDKLVEVQGTAEHGAFSRKELDRLVDLAQAGITELFAAQRKTLGL